MDESVAVDTVSAPEGGFDNLEVVSVADDPIIHDETPEGMSGDNFWKEGNEIAGPGDSEDGDTVEEEDKEVATDEGDGEQPEEVDPLAAELEEIKAKNERLEEAHGKAEVQYRRNGDPSR